MKKIILISVLLLFSNLSCSVYETMVNLSQLKFKLDDVSNFTISGINLSNKKSYQDFDPLELLNLTQAIGSGKLPASFTLNVEAKNPNDGTGGYPKTDATLKAFPWRLNVDQTETISGNIGSPVSVPGTGEVTYIPLNMNIDLIQFFIGLFSLLSVLAIGAFIGDKLDKPRNNKQRFYNKTRIDYK